MERAEAPPPDKRNEERDSPEVPASETADNPTVLNWRGVGEVKEAAEGARGDGERRRSRNTLPCVSKRAKRSRADSVRAAKLRLKDMLRSQERWHKLEKGGPGEEEKSLIAMEPQR